MHPIRILCISLVLLAGLTAAPASIRAAESYDNCTGFIDSIPATISTQGTWCLRKDLTTAMTSGAAITIDTNNVTIDCNDFKVGGLAGGPGTGASGIVAYHRLNITVRNCNVRGFLYGLNVPYGGGHVIEDNRFDGNTYRGILVGGDGSVVQRNHVRDTGGGTNVVEADGIVTSEAVDVLDNTISGVMPAMNASGNSWANGIYLFANPSGSIRGNRVRSVFAQGSGIARGIHTYSSGRISVTDNHLIGDGSSGSFGLVCSSNDGRAVNNIINGFATGIVGCRDDGNSL